ncbi:MAG: OprO/OprP family phosphate-selective porin [Stenotrophomonas sp.]|uniref:OprO/OprP family phosphate-selective porin n=1 Tax=Stenotrophomonas sp. TaxID=69392 RepID=UPI003D6D9490
MPITKTRYRASLLLALVAAPSAQADDDVTLKASGRLHYEFAYFDNDRRGTPERDGDDLRSAWLAIAGKFHVIDYKFEADFAGHRPVARDAYIARSIGSTTLLLGQFKPISPLDDRISTNHAPTVERSWLMQTLPPSYRLGVGATGHHDGMFWGASLYSLESIDAWKHKGSAVGTRIGYAPWHSPGQVLHLGMSAARENYDHPGTRGAAPLRVQLRTAGYFADNSRLALIDYRSGRDVEATKLALESAGVHGAFSWQAEYGKVRYNDGQQRGEVQSGYVLGSWVITGESPSYDVKAGRFGPIKPTRRSGAWELEAQYDQIRGRQWPLDRHEGAADAWTVGVNWYAPRHVRLMLDWTDSRRRATPGGRTLDHTGVLAGRVQFDF